LNLAWSPLPPARTQPSRSSRLMIAALFMVCNFTHTTAASNSAGSSAKPFYRTGKTLFGRRSERVDLSSSLGDWNIAEAISSGGTNEIAVPLFPAGFFGSVVAVLSRGCRPFGFLLGDRLLVFVNRVAVCSRGGWRWLAFRGGFGRGLPHPSQSNAP
jgi:hypothetical protein